MNHGELVIKVLGITSQWNQSCMKHDKVPLFMFAKRTIDGKCSLEGEHGEYNWTSIKEILQSALDSINKQEQEESNG